MNSDYPSTKPQLTAADFHGHDAQHMNSLQIAELVQSRHDSVKRTIERLVEQEIIACPPMVDVQENKGNSRNYTTQTYFFSGEQGKLDSITVAAQLCPRFTAAIVKRWQELEQHNSRDNTAELTILRATTAPAPCLRRLFVHNTGRGVENLVNSGLPHPTLWFFYARTGNPVMPGGQRIQHPRGESSRLTVYSFRTPRRPYNRESSKNLNRSQS